jgi:hypothetical protein
MRVVWWVVCALLALAAHQFVCSWLGPATISCHLVGVCLPEAVCPSDVVLPGLTAVFTLYSGYAQALLATTRVVPALTCLKHRLSAVNTAETTEALLETHQLETTGLEIAAETRALMRDIETHVVSPMHAFSDAVESTLLSNETVQRGEMVASVVHIGSAVSEAATHATTMALRMDAFASDLRKFGYSLRHYHIPKLQNHRDAKVPAGLKLSAMMLVGGIAGCLYGAPLTVAGVVLYGVPTAVLGAVGSITVSSLETKWAQDGQMVRVTGNDIHPYSDLVASGVTAIQAAARGLDDIHAGLVQLRGTMGLALNSTADVSHLLGVVARLRAQTEELETAIETERRHLVASRDHVHIADGSAACI